MKKFIYLGIIGVGVYFIYKKYMKFTDRLTYKINSIKFNLDKSLDTEFKTMYFTVDTTLINPEPINLKVNSLQLFFSTKNKTFAQIITQDNFIIKAKNSMSIKLPLEIDLNSLPVTFKNILTNFKKGELSINIFGKVSTELGEVKFNEVKSLL